MSQVNEWDWSVGRRDVTRRSTTDPDQNKKTKRKKSDWVLIRNFDCEEEYILYYNQYIRNASIFKTYQRMICTLPHCEHEGEQHTIKEQRLQCNSAACHTSELLENNPAGCPVVWKLTTCKSSNVKRLLHNGVLHLRGLVLCKSPPRVAFTQAIVTFVEDLVRERVRPVNIVARLDKNKDILTKKYSLHVSWKNDIRTLPHGALNVC